MLVGLSIWVYSVVRRFPRRVMYRACCTARLLGLAGIKNFGSSSFFFFECVMGVGVSDV